MGTTYWKELTDKELEELRQKRNMQIEDGEIQEPSRRTRSDKGKKRVRRSSDDPPSHKKYKSAETIVNSDDEQGEEHGLPQTPRSSPAATQGLVVSNANPTAAATSPAKQTATTKNIDPTMCTATSTTTPEGPPALDFDIGTELQQQALEDFADSLLNFDGTMTGLY